MKADTNIVVASTEIDTYGNQIITATDGQEYKIGEKRAHLHSLAQPDTPLILKWDNYMNKDYVKDVLVNASAPQPNPAAPAPQRPVAPVTPPGNKDAQIARAVALKAGVDNTAVGVDPKVIVAQAKAFLPFLMGIIPTTTAAPAPATTTEEVSPTVTKDALVGLLGIAKDAEGWTETVAEKKAWLGAAALRLYGKGDIKEITEDELGDLTAKLAEHIEKQKEENPF